MKFYIVTPSYNQLDRLKLCVASVADQAAPEAQRSGGGDQKSDRRSSALSPLSSESGAPLRVHHHVQDARSSDGTPEWLAEYAAQQPATSNYQLTFASETDEGMYDALNRGWEKAPEDADIIAHLNCDEQYLPGALQKVADCFSKNRNADVVFADMIVVDGKGDYLCHRRPLPPMPVISRLFIPGFTCTTFQRRRVFFEKGCRFDTTWKNLGDVIWYRSLINSKCRFQMLNEYTSLFTDTGENLNLMESGREERARYCEMLPGWIKAIYPAAFFLKHVRYAVRMFVSKTPTSYELYLPERKERVRKLIEHPTCVWKTRKQWRHAMIQAGK